MARSFVAASSQYLHHTSGAAVSNAPLTMACWFNSVSAGGIQQLISVLTDSADGKEHCLRLRGDLGGDPIEIVSDNGPSASVAATTTGYSTSTWHHAAGVWVSTASRNVFIDGGSKGSDTTSVGSVAKNEMAIGARLTGTGNPDRFFDGQIAEAAIWDVALTDAEVAILAQGFSPLLVRPQNLLGYWPLIGRYSPEIDLVRGRDMTLTNSPTTADHPRVLHVVPPRPVYLASTVVSPATDTLVLFGAHSGRLPASNAPARAFRNQHTVLNFDDSTDESIVFNGVMPKSYAGGGLTVAIHYAMVSAVSGNVVWEAAFERIGDQQQDIDSDGFATAKASASTAVPGVNGSVDVVNTVFSDGAEIDNIAAGEAFRLKISRDADGTNGFDTAVGDAQVLLVEVGET